ncbi:AraC family transcriptional regulator [Luteolibacter marinus]|uniref:AraC family transcriptional regulator n=1 Tax=Luteolibacter marinus TaxID=2776705 RepID=UPI001D0214A9|nr:AraC family transcriptional regulator [Luteolibacter marinus]
MVKRVLERIPGPGEQALGIPNLTVYRFDQPTAPNAYMLEPSVCLILQGRKWVAIGENQHVYDASRFFVTSLDLPVVARILDASPDQPYVGLLLRLDRRQLAELVMEQPMPGPGAGSRQEVIELGALTPTLLGAFERLLALADEPESIPVLSPLIQKEILYRLLSSECGAKLRQIATGGSPTQQIGRTIDWIKANLAERLRVEDLAQRAGMSVSTLHHHFRALTSLSPLQFQKRLRLNEARRRMLNGQMDAATAAFEVGYESPSQFSREYSRLFGAPPIRDIRSLGAAIAG